MITERGSSGLLAVLALACLLGLTGFKDTQCGFKLLDGDVARDLAARLNIDGFAYDVELLHNAKRRGYRVHAIGVRWDHQEPSSVPVIGAGTRMVLDAFRIRWRTTSRAARGFSAVMLLAGGCWESRSRNIAVSGGRFRAFDSGTQPGKQRLIDSATGDTWRLESTGEDEPTWVLIARGPDDARAIDPNAALGFLPSD